MPFRKQRRHLERYVEIGRILARHGWENFLSRIGLADIFSLRHRYGGVPPGPEQVKETLEELGPTFIKLGQVLSTRPDIIPPEYASALETLQDDAAGVPINEIKKVIEEEFGMPPNQVFSYFDESPLAAASLGQTHLAILHDNREVVVKIQRPGIQRIIQNDMEIISGIVRFLEQHFPRLSDYNLSDLVDEFSITLKHETDYTREGRNGDRFKDIFKDVPYIKLAETIWEYTTPRVLTQGRLCGIKINDIDEILVKGYNPDVIANNLSNIFLKMVFEDGFFHADPHPGNLVVMEDNTIGLLDYGMVGSLDNDLRLNITMLMSEYVQQNSSKFAEMLLSMGSSPLDMDRKSYARSIDRLLREYYGSPLGEVRMGEVLSRAVNISAKYKIRLPASLGLLVKVILGVESIDRLLNPDYDFAYALKPYINQSIKHEFTLSQIKTQLVNSLIHWKWLMSELPHRTSEVLDHMANGSFRIIFKHEGLDIPTRDIDRSANRLSISFVTGASIVASALILSANIGPTWNGYSVLGLFGFVVSFIFSVVLVISIIRAGKLW